MSVDSGGIFVFLVGLIAGGLICGFIFAPLIPGAERALGKSLMIRLRAINPLLRGNVPSASDRSRAGVVGDAIQEMLDANDLQTRLRALAHVLHEMGWNQVTVALANNSLVIDEPPGAPAVNDRWKRWNGYLPQVLDRHRIGPGYFFSEGEGPNWQPGDKLFVPLRSEGDTITLIELSAPTNGKRPTAESLRAVGLLADAAHAGIENHRLRGELEHITNQLQQQIEELVMMQRVDQELSSTLNFDNVMMLTMDWAIRRTGATAGIVNMGTSDGSAMYPVAALGYPLNVMQRYSVNNPMPLSVGIGGRAARLRQMQIIGNVSVDPDYVPMLDSTRSQIAVPMEMRGRVLGVLTLESDRLDAFNESHVSFIQRLAGRAVVAMDNARLYTEAEDRADEMAALYSAGRSVSASLERGDVQNNTAQALAAILGVSSAVVADYRADRNQLTVTAAYRLGTARGARDNLPAVGATFDLTELPDLAEAIRGQRVLVMQSADTHLPPHLRDLLSTFSCQTLLAAPLALPDQILGVALAFEGRRPREFSQDEMLIVESLTSQASSALRQAKLYEDVRELENMKSEMIRMASHDLRNPLGNVMGYFDLIVNNLSGLLTDKLQVYIEAHRHSTGVMNSLIEDLLTLERIESERQAAWKAFDLGDLVSTVVGGQRSAAELKRQALTLTFGDDRSSIMVFGSKTQLRQAVTNLVGNGIKYTPDGGRIQIRLAQQDKRLIFEVQDNGYGISKERQGRLFQRFYRAREKATEDIPGTGLGLSLVKTVVERHGGEVWVQSESGKGSTFGFWLPEPDPLEIVSAQQAEEDRAAALSQEPEA